MPLSPKLLSALTILKTLRDKGFDAYIVGGFVRDYCICVSGSCAEAGDFFDRADSYDIDIASSAEPSQIELLFPGAVPSGLKYGTMTILADAYRFEHTTFRSDFHYPRGSRKPEIRYSRSLEEDVARRDFKMNALAMNPDFKIIDYFGGREDIENHLISTVGEPRERFREDSLRKLRALRFVSKLGFDLAPEAEEALKEDSSLPGTSMERIRQEFSQILMGPHVYKALGYMRDLGMFEAFVPEIIPTIGFEQHSKYHDFTVFEHIMRAVSNAPEDEEIRTAAFFHDIAKPLKFTLSDDGQGHFKGHDKEGAELTGLILERLRYPKASIERITGLIARHHSLPGSEIRAVRHFVSKVGIDRARKQLELAFADNSSKKRESPELKHLHDLNAMIEEVIASDCPLELRDLAVNGDDIIRHLSLVPEERPLLGSIMAGLLDRCLDEPELNTRAELLELSEEFAYHLRGGGSHGL